MNSALLLLGSLLLAMPAAGSLQRPLIITTQDHSLTAEDTCRNFHTRNTTSLPALAQEEETRTLRMAHGQNMRVRASQAGGVTVRGWSRPFAQLTICKSAVALNAKDAEAVLRAVKVTADGSGIAASGPSTNGTQAWWAHMILLVPRGASLEIFAADGGIAIRNMHGRVTARATNGGISLAACAGESQLQTENGGISLEDVSGKVHAVSQNGPISLKLRDEVPALEAQTAVDGEILCRLQGCGEGSQARWTADRKHLRIGSAPLIRLTSHRADIMIEQAH